MDDPAEVPFYYHYSADDLFVVDAVQGSIEGYWDDFQARWGLNEDEPPAWMKRDDWLTARILDRIASNWIKAARHLGQPAGYNPIPEIMLDLDELSHGFGEDLRENQFIEQRVQVGLALGSAESLFDQGRRAIALLKHLISVPGERAKAYLTRVADCYINGMETEGVVMCRAVLDAALQEGLDNGTIVRAGNAKLNRIDKVDLDDRLRHLKRERAVSGAALAAANRVRTAGNDAVHVSPGLAELEETLQDLVVFLQGWSPVLE